jgi:hypothetical protein
MIDIALNTPLQDETTPESLEGRESLETLVGSEFDDILAGNRDGDLGESDKDRDWLATDTERPDSASEEIEEVGRQCGIEVEAIDAIQNLPSAAEDVLNFEPSVLLPL